LALGDPFSSSKAGRFATGLDMIATLPCPSVTNAGDLRALTGDLSWLSLKPSQSSADLVLLLAAGKLRYNSCPEISLLMSKVLRLRVGHVPAVVN